MSMQAVIEAKIREALAPAHLSVVNESHKHRVPPGSEKHFRVVVVADAFADKPRIARHQMVNRILAAELEGPVHALSVVALTPQEWAARGGAVGESPPCLGHGKAAEG